MNIHRFASVTQWGTTKAPDLVYHTFLSPDTPTLPLWSQLDSTCMVTNTLIWNAIQVL